MDASQVMPPSDVSTNLQLVLRWVHVVAGILWIGLLYFFNLVTPQVMPKLDGAARGKVVETLLPPALWWFRWSAVVTVLTGFLYWVLLLSWEPSGSPGKFTWETVGGWFLFAVLVWIAYYLGLQIPAVAKNGWIVAALVGVLVGWFGYHFVTENVFAGMSNRTISIGVGGGIGLFLLLNVWGIVWPAQKRLIAWTKENPGAAPPPELAKRLRQAHLASRTGFWLTIPIIFFMVAASHYPLFSGR